MVPERDRKEVYDDVIFFLAKKEKVIVPAGSFHPGLNPGFGVGWPVLSLPPQGPHSCPGGLCAPLLLWSVAWAWGRREGRQCPGLSVP